MSTEVWELQWLAVGGQIAVLQEPLGHADLKATAIYAKVTEGLVRAESWRIERLRGGA